MNPFTNMLHEFEAMPVGGKAAVIGAVAGVGLLVLAIRQGGSKSGSTLSAQSPGGPGGFSGLPTQSTGVLNSPGINNTIPQVIPDFSAIVAPQGAYQSAPTITAIAGGQAPSLGAGDKWWQDNFSALITPASSPASTPAPARGDQWWQDMSKPVDIFTRSSATNSLQATTAPVPVLSRLAPKVS